MATGNSPRKAVRKVKKSPAKKRLTKQQKSEWANALKSLGRRQ